ncbi:UCH-domain-containing protein [Podospora fimiseda]|uniref:UCH-domain-containing protein n=1 Tax=Podospora fimiseda TaxID=252190 RepID=A0AAN7H7A7_9PEZI|nr:UCH-domain-containing protein [Podospora fimiseda]
MASSSNIPPSPSSVQVEVVTEKLEIPSLDDRSYRVIRLPNGLEALLVHDPTTDKASAACDVNVGAFSDEDDMPGMAHAVEHLLFMGTKKYPVENAYNQYMSSHAGHTNAYTASTSTNYHFEVSAKPENDEEPSATNPSPLLEALDRFSQFFVEPLFLEETLDRELRAVDSENKKNLQNDQWRLHQLKKTLSNPNHPHCHFSTGNVETLKTIPEAKGINVRDKFIEFYQKHYSANRMKVCVLGREPLDLLQSWVVEYFAPIVNKNLVPNRWENEVPYDSTRLGVQIFAKPVMDTRELTLSFPFNEQEKLYESQPSRYLSHLIGHEGPGSIMSYIKSKGWANALGAGPWAICPGTPDVFDVTITLTEEGQKHYKEVVKVVFEYIAMLRESEPLEWIFEEQKGISEVNFKFLQKSRAYRFTSTISNRMQKPIPREHLVVGYSKLRKFDPELIKQALDCLRPDNFFMTIVGRNFPGASDDPDTWEDKEKWYGTEYTLRRIPAQFMDEINAAMASTPATRTAKLHLPHKNNFIPTKLDVEKKEVQTPAIAPKIIRNDAIARTWFKKDDTFWVPKGSLALRGRTPVIDGAAGRAKSRLVTELIKDALEEYSYDAELAGLEYTVYSDTKGFYMDVSGYNDKLAVLFEQVLVTVRDLEVKDDRFAIVKERLVRGFENWELQAPWHQIGSFLNWLTADGGSVTEEISAELLALTVETIRSFKQEMLAQMHMEVFVHGNFYKEDALKLTDLASSVLKPRVFPPQQWKIRRGLIFPPGSNYIWRKTLKDPANVNHCIQYYLYTGEKADRVLKARRQLLVQIMTEPCFNQLRTKEQLGYVVFCGPWSSVTTTGIYFTIQSEKTAPYLETRIETFLDSVPEILKEMNNDDFEKHKRSLIDKILEKPKQLEQETSKHWAHIESEYYCFDQAERDVAHLKPISKEELIEFFDHFVKPSSPSRAKLAIYLDAQAKSDVTTKQISDLIKTLSLSDAAAAQAATDLQSRLSAAHHDEEEEVKALKEYLLHSLNVAETKIEPAVAVWRKLHGEHGPGSGVVKDSDPPSSNGTTPVFITDVHDFKAGLATTKGPCPEKDLSEQLAFTTSSQKKRRRTRQATREHRPEDLVLPSTEIDQEPTFSFSASAAAAVPSSGLNTPSYVRADSLPATGIPPRLQTQGSSLTDYSPSETASSPCTVSADFSIDVDRASDIVESGVQANQTPQPYQASLQHSVHRALMGGAADYPHRSSSPLKRPASSMEPETENADGREDVDMIMDDDAKEEASTAAQIKEDAMEGVSTSAPADEAVRSESTGVEEIELVNADRIELPLRTEYVLISGLDMPPLDQQIKTIETLVKAFAETAPREGDQAYLVSRKWLNRAQAFGSDPKHASKEVPTGALGPVDNSDIIQAIFNDSNRVECVKLKPGLGAEHFELFPKDAWDMLLSWYGLAAGQKPVIRIAHNTAPDAVSDPVIQFEFYPPVFTIHRLWSEHSPIPIEQEIKLKKPAPPILVKSTSFAYHKFLKQAKNLTGIAPGTKVRVWRILQTIPATEPTTASTPSGMKTPPDSPGRGTEILDHIPVVPGSWPEMLVDVVSFSKLEKGVERALVESDDTTVNLNYNGKKSLALVGLAVDETLVIDESVDKDYVSSLSSYHSSVKDKGAMARGTSTSLIGPVRTSSSGRNSPAIQSAPLTRGRAQQKSGRTNGCVGLQNLGNTCYMNSALQCLRSVEELTKYFLTHEAHKEINPDNPLSHNGDVATAYGRLLDEIYRDPTPNSVAPRNFKSVIGRYAPTFSGYGQQDSQEFLGWLLDGLQEDLNRIKKKPYIEKPDSTDEMIGNPAAIRELAMQVWDITKKRDDSVIADLFTGMYQSTLVCPQCSKVSITFDPFTNLTLPLPMANSWTHTVKYYPLNDHPVNIIVDFDKNSSVKALKQYISARTGVPPENLMASEEFQGKFFKHYDDTATVSEEINSNDTPAVYELEAPPTNIRPPKPAKKQKYRSLLNNDDDEEEKPAWDDPMAERMVVPVIHLTERLSKRNSKDIGSNPPPHFIVLTPSEARDDNIIRRKILEKIATFTTLDLDADADGEEATDPEMVNMASDADSSDTKIMAKSVEGEEDIVDVSMSDSASVKPPVSASIKEPLSVLKQFNKRRPTWIDPQEFLPANLQNMFNMCYFQDSSAGVGIPTGWQSANHGNHYPSLTSRLPKPVASDVEMRSPGPWEGSDGSASDEATRVTRMNDETSEEEDSDLNGPNKFLKAKQPVLGPASRGGKKKLKPRQQTYSKKGKKRFEKQQAQQQRSPRGQNSYQQPDAEDDSEGPLVRLGEGIICEWNEDAFDVLFAGGDANGSYTYGPNAETLQDPVLEAKKKQRMMRKKHGISLNDCLDEFQKEEILSEQDTWYCPRCKAHQRASKKFDLWKTPDILVVHLKRFSSSGFRRDKLDTLVDFPVEGLDLSSRVIDKEDGKQEIYDLIAVDDHWGGLGGGHYTAYAKNFNDNQWYEYNDTSVSKTQDPQKVVSSAAYLLFYRRRSEVPLGGPRFQEIFDKYDAGASESGEEQRLGQGSSLRQTLPLGKRGLVSELPSYQATIGGDDDMDVGVTLSTTWSAEETLHNSVEGDDDEAIDLNHQDYDGMAGIIGPSTNWSFANLNNTSKVNSDASDIASDVAQNDGRSSLGGDVGDFGDESAGDAGFPDDDPMDRVFMGPHQPESGFVEGEVGPAEQLELDLEESYTPYQDDIPPPTDEAQVCLGQIAEQSWKLQNAQGGGVLHKVPPQGLMDTDDGASDKVAEIHIKDGDDQQQPEIDKTEETLKLKPKPRDPSDD